MKRKTVILTSLLLLAAISIALYSWWGAPSDTDGLERMWEEYARALEEHAGMREGYARMPQEHARRLAELRKINPDSHAMMLEQLKRIKGDFETSHWTTPRDLLNRRLLEVLPESGADNERFSLNFKVANNYLNLGMNQQAVTHMQQAEKLLPRVRESLSNDEYKKVMFGIAVAYLRKAETDNCVCLHNSESCLLPITGGGVHQEKESARAAIDVLLRLLKHSPEHASARWLLNLSYMVVGEYPNQVPQHLLIPPKAFESNERFPRFREIAGDLGVTSLDLAGGAIVDDFDNDGFLDVVTSTWDPAGQIRYFHNDGDGTFSDRTSDSGLDGILGGLNLVQADYDNDGNVNIFVLRGGWLYEKGHHPNSLIRNEGNGKFRDVTFHAGLGNVYYPTQTASWSDYDLDGDLDLFVGNERSPCQLFENRGDGTFADVAKLAGVLNESQNSYGLTKGVIWGDVNSDGWPDLYVSNYGQPNRLYWNNGDKTFRDVAPELKVTGPRKSFPVWFWDYNNDGALDLFVASFHQNVRFVAADYLDLPHGTELDCLYENDGTGRFTNRATELNLNHVTLPMGSNFGDLDNDGYLDFYLGTGYPEFDGLMPNLMYRNCEGKRFADVTTSGGFGHLQKGHGVAFADLDNDGDQDIYMQLGGWYPGDAFGNALFENPGFGNNWIAIKLVGKESNRSAIGARIRLEIEENGIRRQIYRWVNSGGSFGANPLRQHIGLGKASRIESLEVYWPASKHTQRFTAVPAGQFVEIQEFDKELKPRTYETVKFRLRETNVTDN